MRAIPITLILAVDNEGEATDAINETLRPHTRDHAPASCILDYAIGTGIRLTGDGVDYVEGDAFGADVSAPTAPAVVVCLTPKHAALLSDESLRYVDTEEECAALGPNGLCCTRGTKHDGPHVAHVEDAPVAMWTEVDAVPTPSGARYRLRATPTTPRR